MNESWMKRWNIFAVESVSDAIFIGKDVKSACAVLWRSDKLFLVGFKIASIQFKKNINN